MSQVEIPATLEEFYFELGKEIVRATTQVRNASFDALLNDPEQKTGFIQMGALWCSYRRKLLVTIWQSAHLLGPGMPYQLINKLPECKEFLESCEPGYFDDILRAGLALRGKPYRDFTDLLAQIATGI